MDEQTRATFLLTAATLAASQIKNQRFNGVPKDAVMRMLDVLKVMEEQGIVPPGVDRLTPEMTASQDGKLEQF